MKRTRGLTLVEVVVVILVIAILAAVAVPRFIGASTQATEAGLRQTLGVVRNGIDLYAAEHGGVLPGAVSDGANLAGSGKSFRRQLRYFSREDGTVSQTDRLNYPLGPYIRGGFPRAPLGPKQGAKSVRVVSSGTPLDGKASPGNAWKYDDTTGEFILNFNGLSSDGVTPYDEY